MSQFNDVSSVLLKNKLERDAAKAVEVPQGTPEIVNAQTPTTQTIAKPAEAAPAVKPETVSSEPAPAEKAKPAAEVEPAPAEETKFVWDKDIPESSGTPVADAPTLFDLKKVGSALSLETKTEEEFVKQVSEKFSKLKELEALSLDGIPEQLKGAIEVAKKGGNWQEYAGVTALDATKLDATEVFEREYERANIERFKNPDGSYDYEKFDQELLGIPQGLKQMQGNAIKSQIIARQQQQQASVIAQAAAQQDRFQKSLGDAARELSTLLPQDQFGIKIEPKHATYLYEGIANGSLLKKHLGGLDPASLSKLDSKKLMKTIAIAEFGERISQHQFKQGEVAGKKAVLLSTQNTQLTQSSSLPKPEEKDTTIDSTGMLKAAQAKQKPKNSL